MLSSKVIVLLSLFSVSSAFPPFFDRLYNDYDDYTSFTSQSDFESIQLDDPVCRDETTGQPLDWFTLYKLPKRTQILESSRVNNPFIYEGTAYTYMTNLAQSEWSLSSLSMNDTSSFAGKTLDILYKSGFGSLNPNQTSKTTSSKLGYILYNDQADKVSLTKGHTKGVIIFNENKAIWIVHSIPHFPPKPSDSGYQIHSSQCVYGQQFFCMSIKPMELEKIGQQLLYTFPQVYDSYIPEFAKEAPHFKNLLKVLNNEHAEMKPWSNLNYFTTSGGEKLLSIAKYTDFEDDLYTALVAPTLEADMYTETWNNGAGTLESNCSNVFNYQVHNIEQIKFDSFGVRFSVHHDHSKWAVTTDKRANSFWFDRSAKEIACIGDINRQEEQFKRAGGTVCFMDNRNVWEQYSKIVDQVEPCRKGVARNKRMTQGKRLKFPGSRNKIVMLG